MRQATRRAAWIVWPGMVGLILFAAAMTTDLVYDEDQYIAAGVMARHYTLYRDFIYFQPPLYPLLLSALFGWTDGYYLLTGRLATFVLSAGACILLARILIRLGAGALLAALLVSACLASPFLWSTTSNSRNDILPLFLLLAGLLAYLRAGPPGAETRLMLVLAGLFAGLAVTAKLSYVFAPIVLASHCLGAAGGWRTAARTRLAPVLIGILLAASLGLYYLAIAPWAFAYELFFFHLTGPIAWYTREGQEASLLFPARAAALAEMLPLGGNVSLILLALAFTAIWRWWPRPGAGERTIGPPAGLVLALLGAALFCGFQPRPSWPMYYAPVAPLLACWVALLHARIRGLLAPRVLWLMILIALAPSVPVLGLRVSAIARLALLDNWAGLSAHRAARQIHDAIHDAGGQPGDVATLFPILVLDANPVRPEFASGPFFFRTADLLGARQIAALHGTSPDGLEALFAAAPPAAIFGGLYATAWKAPMDAALLAYAERHGYALSPARIGGGGKTGGMLYVRPWP